MDALTIMFYGNKTLMDALNAVDTVDWDRPNVCGVWSVKDIVSHLAASELLTSDIFGLFTGAAEKPMFDRMAAAYATWNDDTVAERRGLNAEQALAEYKTAYLEKMARAELSSCSAIQVLWLGMQRDWFRRTVTDSSRPGP